MHPALAPGQILLTRPRSTGVAVGDVVVLTTTRGTLYVKRVAARAGDVVALEHGRLYVNDRLRNGQAGVRGAHAATWQVPDSHYFVVGDNLRESDDSRVWAAPFVAASRINGVVLGRWPWRRLAGPAVTQPGTRQ